MRTLFSFLMNCMERHADISTHVVFFLTTQRRLLRDLCETLPVIERESKGSRRRSTRRRRSEREREQEKISKLESERNPVNENQKDREKRGKHLLSVERRKYEEKRIGKLGTKSSRNRDD